MVAIIGNKGSGKSALADVLALAGNTHCDPKYFSFLNKDRFCERNGRLATQFEVETLWEDGTQTVTSLNARPDLNSVELVKYIPQTYLEKVCTEMEPGQKSEFQRELRKVIFSHIRDADRLGRESLDELIDYKTEELAEQLAAHRQDISRLNAELVRLEARGTAENVAQLEAKLKQKHKELEAHHATKPAAVEKPNNLTPAEQKVYSGIAADLEKERAALSGIETKIAEHISRQKTLADHITTARKLEGKLQNFEDEFDRLKQECAADLEKLSLDFDAIVKLTIDHGPLTKKRTGLAGEKDRVDTALSPDEDTSLLSQKESCEGRIKGLQDKLDAPSKRYQVYQEKLKAWEQQRALILGDAETGDTIRYYNAQLKHIREKLPQEIATAREKRANVARKIHEAIGAIRDVYEELFAPVQQLIEDSVIIKEGFKLTFDSSIIERTFQRDFFERYISQSVAGSFCGKEKGASVLEELRAEYQFNQPGDAIAFIENITSHLLHDMRSAQEGKMTIASQLRKHVELKSSMITYGRCPIWSRSIRSSSTARTLAIFRLASAGLCCWSFIFWSTKVISRLSWTSRKKTSTVRRFTGCSSRSSRRSRSAARLSW